MQSQGFCLRHNDYPVTVISFKNDKVSLLCEDCLLNLRDQNEKVDVANLIFIRKAIKQPQYLLSKLKLDHKFQQFFDVLTKLDEREIEEQVLKFENELKKIQQTINLVIVEIQQLSKTLILNRKQLQVDLMNVTHYEQFQMAISELNQNVNYKQIESIEQKLELYLDGLKKSQTLPNDIENIFQKCKQQITNPQLMNLDHQIQEFQYQIQQFYRNINPNQEIVGQILQTKQQYLVSQEYLAYLNNVIQDKTQKKISGVDLIYQSASHGLNTATFWNKVNGKTNLLIILKSQTNSIFGGYTPCMWIQSIGNFVPDKSLTSFLFSMNHQQIYPIKQKSCQNAIYCASSYGPTFGGGHDIYINMDFKTGYSRLGHTYEWQHEQAQETNVHLFGGLQPNIIECEVFEITLK